MKYNYEVTVAVMTYHPNIEKLKKTIQSVLMQKNVKMEILVADDGSPENHFEEVEAFFKEENFTDYKMLPQPENTGTEKNLYKALNAASGKYFKFISPGDYLNGENCLHEWISFMEEKEALISFSDLIAYEEGEDGDKVTKSISAKPQIAEPYDTGDLKQQKEWILWMNDLCCGATVMGDTSTLKKYISLMIDRVVYSEDFAVRLAIADNVVVWHYKSNAIWYESDTGISSGVSDVWVKRIEKDFVAVNDILLEQKDIMASLPSRFAWSFRNYGRMPEGKYKILKLMKDPTKAFYVLKMRREPRMTEV